MTAIILCTAARPLFGDSDPLTKAGTLEDAVCSLVPNQCVGGLPKLSDPPDDLITRTPCVLSAAPDLSHRAEDPAEIAQGDRKYAGTRDTTADGWLLEH